METIEPWATLSGNGESSRVAKSGDLLVEFGQKSLEIVASTLCLPVGQHVVERGFEKSTEVVFESKFASLVTCS